MPGAVGLIAGPCRVDQIVGDPTLPVCHRGIVEMYDDPVRLVRISLLVIGVDQGIVFRVESEQS